MLLPNLLLNFLNTALEISGLLEDVLEVLSLLDRLFTEMSG